MAEITPEDAAKMRDFFDRDGRFHQCGTCGQALGGPVYNCIRCGADIGMRAAVDGNVIPQGGRDSGLTPNDFSPGL